MGIDSVEARKIRIVRGGCCVQINILLDDFEDRRLAKSCAKRATRMKRAEWTRDAGGMSLRARAVKQSLPGRKLAAFERAADVGVVSPPGAPRKK